MLTKQYLRGLTSVQLKAFNWFKSHPKFKLLVDYKQITIERNYYPVECIKCKYGKKGNWKPRLDSLMQTNRCPNDALINRIRKQRKRGYKRYYNWYLNTNVHNQIYISNWDDIRKEYLSERNIKADFHLLKQHRKGISPARHVKARYQCNHCGYIGHKLLVRLKRKFKHHKILCGYCASKAHTKRQMDAKLREFKTWCHNPEVKKYVNVVGCKKLNRHNYHGQNTRVQSICQKCGYGSGTRKWYPPVQSLMDPRHKDICPKCAKTLKLTPEEINFRISTRIKNPIYVHYDHSLPQGTDKLHADCFCPKHKKRWSPLLAGLLCGHGCQDCSRKFKNELNAEHVFDTCGIPECANKAELYKCNTGYLHSYSIPPKGYKMTDNYNHEWDLSIDFMLKINGKYYPIELDGLQHKVVVDFSGRVSKLKKKHASQERINKAENKNDKDLQIRKQRDAYKDQWAKDRDNCAKMTRIECYNEDKKTTANPSIVLRKIYGTLFSLLKFHHVSGCPDAYYKLLNKISKDKLKHLPKHLSRQIVINGKVYQLL